MRNHSAFLKIWADSSAGRALPLQGRGHRFDPCSAYHHRVRSSPDVFSVADGVRRDDPSCFFYGAVVQPGLGRQIVNLEVAGSNPVGPAKFSLVSSGTLGSCFHKERR
jgi:hypothetical protein